MRKWLTGLTVLALGLPVLAQDSGETKKKSETPAKKVAPPTAPQAKQSEGQKKLREIQMEFSKLQQEALKDYRAAKPEDQQKLIPATQAKLDKLPKADFSKKALDLVPTLDENDPAVMQAMQFATQMDPASVAQVEKIAKESKSKTVRGSAYFFAAQTQMMSASMPAPGKTDTAELEKKAEANYETVVKEYADLPYGNSTMGETAKNALFELKNLTVGKVAPEVVCLNIDGNKSDKLSNYRGKVVVVDIWATWCGPCVAMIPHEKEMVEKLKGKPFALISVSGDNDQATLVKFLEKTSMPWTHWFADRKGILKDWNIRFFPTIYVIDHKGVIRAKGLRGDKLEEKVNELLSEMAKEKVG